MEGKEYQNVLKKPTDSLMMLVRKVNRMHPGWSLEKKVQSAAGMSLDAARKRGTVRHPIAIMELFVSYELYMKEALGTMPEIFIEDDMLLDFLKDGADIPEPELLDPFLDSQMSDVDEGGEGKRTVSKDPNFGAFIMNVMTRKPGGSFCFAVLPTDTCYLPDDFKRVMSSNCRYILFVITEGFTGSLPLTGSMFATEGLPYTEKQMEAFSSHLDEMKKAVNLLFYMNTYPDRFLCRPPKGVSLAGHRDGKTVVMDEGLRKRASLKRGDADGIPGIMYFRKGYWVRYTAKRYRNRRFTTGWRRSTFVNRHSWTVAGTLTGGDVDECE